MTPFKDTRFQQMTHAEEDTGAESHVPPPGSRSRPFRPSRWHRSRPSRPGSISATSFRPAWICRAFRWLRNIAGRRRRPRTLPRPRSAHLRVPITRPSRPSPRILVPDPIAPMPQNPFAPGYFDPATAGRLLGSHDEQVVPFRPQSAAPGQLPPTGTIEDTTAELLRPMLRQWLADNMPRMVEKALHIEVAESVRTGRKLPGQ